MNLKMNTLLFTDRMFYSKTHSLQSDHPVCQNLEGGNGYFFTPTPEMGKKHAQQGLDEQPVIDWVLENFVRGDKVFVDIGAHIGGYTVQAAQKAAHVHAFECFPVSFHYLCANIALHGLHFSVDTHQVALSNKEGTALCQNRTNIQADGGGNGLTRFERDDRLNVATVQVVSRTLDSYGLTNVGFIKIDVEGHEKEVLEGAVETLKANHYPPFLFESWYPNPQQEHLIPMGKLREELFAYITSLGYKINAVHGYHEIFLAVHP
jgi:FkbM family methyltransferase